MGEGHTHRTEVPGQDLLWAVAPYVPRGPTQLPDFSVLGFETQIQLTGAILFLFLSLGDHCRYWVAGDSCNLKPDSGISGPLSLIPRKSSMPTLYLTVTIPI